MKCEIFDYPTRWRVWSEEKPDDPPYTVDLCAHQRGFKEDGTPIYNGSCDCKDFVCVQWGKGLKRDPDGTRIYRCKHIRFVRQHDLLDLLLHALRKNDPNIDEQYQT